jgi:phosphate-selective porin
MRTTLATAILGLSSIAGVDAAEADIELYVDKKTRQIFAGPAPGRERLGRFAQVNVHAPKTDGAPVVHRATVPAPAGPATGAWYETIKLRGYTQIRYNHGVGGHARALTSPGDRFIGDNQTFGIRRSRLVFSGQLNEHVSFYIQPDLASTPTGSSTSGFAQIRDAYFDIGFNRGNTIRLRAGQSKIPYGWENLQSSSHRLAPDRADALNSGVRDERDLGMMLYYSPMEAQRRFADLGKNNLKGSGDYGALGIGIYNGQGANRSEGNRSAHAVVHATWPFLLASGQYLEVGADAYAGKFRVASPASTSDNGAPFVPRVDAGGEGSVDRRTAVHVILFPQPFGLQAEWTVGRGPELDVATRSIRTRRLRGGYVQAMYRLTGSYGNLMPYLKWQTYRGASKFDTNTPRMTVFETEAGVEWQPSQALELMLGYAKMRRTDVKRAPYPLVRGDLLRMQLQINY